LKLQDEGLRQGLSQRPDGHPGAFIEKGEFRSFECIGVGDCVSACPHNNVFFFDVRNWIHMKLNMPLPLLAKPVSYGGSESPIDFRVLGKDTGQAVGDEAQQWLGPSLRLPTVSICAGSARD
jgi:ferredoxin